MLHGSQLRSYPLPVKRPDCGLVTWLRTMLAKMQLIYRKVRSDSGSRVRRHVTNLRPSFFLRADEWWKQNGTNERSGWVNWSPFSTKKIKFSIVKPPSNCHFTISTKVLTIFLSHSQQKLLFGGRKFLKFSPFLLTCKELGFRIILSHYKVFFFVFIFSCSSEKGFMSASDNFTNKSLAVFS